MQSPYRKNQEDIEKARLFFMNKGYIVETDKNNNRMIIKKGRLSKWVCFYTTKKLMSACNQFKITDNYETLSDL